MHILPTVDCCIATAKRALTLRVLYLRLLQHIGYVKFKGLMSGILKMRSQICLYAWRKASRSMMTFLHCHTPRAQTLTLLLSHSSPVLIVTIAWGREALQRFNLAILTSAPTFVDLLATASTSTKPRLLLDTENIDFTTYTHQALCDTSSRSSTLSPDNKPLTRWNPA
jgi:hypothetical protein